MGVLTGIKARGVQGILVTVTDKLTGFTKTIKTVFPQSDMQICVVHQIRNAAKYVVWKDKKEFSKDMKAICAAPNEEAARAASNDFEHKWQDKYPYAIKSWQNN